MEKTTRSPRKPWTVILFFSAMVPGTAVLWALQVGGDPVVFRPSSTRKEVSLPRGEVNLFQVLQGIADSTGVTVCYKGEDPPETTIQLARALEKPDLATAAEVLKTNGYDLSDALFKGKTVSWVQKLIVPQRTKGKILRPPEAPEPQKPASGTPGTTQNVDPEARTRPGGRLSLYVRETGGGASYVVTLETDSRKEAEEALSLLKAHRQAKLTGQSK